MKPPTRNWLPLLFANLICLGIALPLLWLAFGPAAAAGLWALGAWVRLARPVEL